MRESDLLMRNFTLPNIIENLIFRHKEKIENPDKLPLNGLMCFCGEQGSGKTLSAVLYVYNICRFFPKAKIVTNIDLFFGDEITNKFYRYKGVEQMINFDNGTDGVVFLIDEMHLEFNSLESKGMDVNTFELVSQQRKARKHIVGTSQVFGRLAKPFREQFKYAVLCENKMGLYFRQEIFRAKNVAYDDDIRTELRSEGVRRYIPSPEMFGMYDTSQIVRRVNHGSDGTRNFRGGR